MVKEKVLKKANYKFLAIREGVLGPQIFLNVNIIDSKKVDAYVRLQLSWTSKNIP